LTQATCFGAAAPALQCWAGCAVRRASSSVIKCAAGRACPVRPRNGRRRARGGPSDAALAVLAVLRRTSVSCLGKTAFACSFQRAAYSCRCFLGHKGTNRGLVVGPLGTEIGATHDRFAPAKLVGELSLQASKDGVGIGHAAFGGHCDHIAPTGG